MDHEVKFSVNRSSDIDILNHLNSCEERFLSELKKKVDLKQYSKKLFDKSVRFEAWQGNTLIGLVAGYFNDPKNFASYISSVSVIIDFSGKGIATALLENAINYGKERNFTIMDLEVGKLNENATKLYQKLGFEIIGANQIDNKMRLKF